MVMVLSSQMVALDPCQDRMEVVQMEGMVCTYHQSDVVVVEKVPLGHQRLVEGCPLVEVYVAYCYGLGLVWTEGLCHCEENHTET